jgi:hypothetical protein
MTSNLLEKVRTGFPSTIDFPDILSQLCNWDENENQDSTISGYFELHENGRDFFSRIIDREETRNRLGIFGSSPDGGLYCIWLQDNGKQPVVYIGSGQFAMVLSANIEDFLKLLAIGYNEICGPDLSQPPEPGSLVNRKFQTWISQILNTSVPLTGQNIVDNATRDSDDINSWLSANCTW